MMRIALIGLGDIAQKAYLPLLCSNEQIIPLLCTRSSETLAKLGRQYRVTECYQDIDVLLASRPDGVMIHAATEAHQHIAQKSLKLGIATFVDKPLCDSSAGAQALAELAMMQNCPLFVGFNRRYLPAMAYVSDHPLTELQWQKNRHQLPGVARDFLFDDFIHVLDSLCFYGGKPQGDVWQALRASEQAPNLLASVAVSWQVDGKVIFGSMNRTAGITQELTCCYGHNFSLHLENCTKGTLAVDNQSLVLNPPDWQSVLSNRGFVAMLSHWYQQIAVGKADGELIESYLHSHLLAEQILAQWSRPN